MELVDLHSKSYAKHEEVRAECSEDRVFSKYFNTPDNVLKDLGIGFLYTGRFISDLRDHSGLKFALKQVSAVGENYNSIHYHLLPNLERFIVEEEYSPVYHVKYVPSYHIMRSLCDGYPWVEDNLGIKLQLRNVPVLTAMPGSTFKPLYEGYTVQVAFSDGDSSRVTTTSNIKRILLRLRMIGLMRLRRSWKKKIFKVLISLICWQLYLGGRALQC